MSRFYRALKEASRARPELTGSSFADFRDTGVLAPEAPPTIKHIEEAAPAQEYSEAPALSYPEDLSKTLEVETPEAGNHSSYGELGVFASLVLDQRARLIPNAVDRAIVEHYRRLRARIIQEQEKKSFRTLVITSPNPQEGKTVTTLNLALSFGMIPSFKVLVIDGDLRKGTLGKALGVGELPGLSNLIEGSAELEDIVLKCDDIPVHFMLRGTAKSPPAELLHFPGLSDHFRKIAEHFSLVIVDSPPVNLVADAQLLSAACDAVLLIARAFATSSKALERAVEELSPFRVIGTVLNRGMRAELYRNYKGYY